MESTITRNNSIVFYDTTDFDDPLDIDWNDDIERWC